MESTPHCDTYPFCLKVEETKQTHLFLHRHMVIGVGTGIPTDLTQYIEQITSTDQNKRALANYKRCTHTHIHTFPPTEFCSLLCIHCYALCISNCKARVIISNPVQPIWTPSASLWHSQLSMQLQRIMGCGKGPSLHTVTEHCVSAKQARAKL